MDNCKIPEKKSLLAIVEAMLAELFIEREPGDKRPTRDDLLGLLDGSSRRMQICFLRGLSAGEIALLRRDTGYRSRLYGSLRKTVTALSHPLLDPNRIRALAAEAATYPIAEARRTPELRAARALARFPIKLDTHPPLTDLRGLFNLLQAILEARVRESESLEELDAGYAFIERELGRTPGIESYLGRAMELAGRISEPGEVVAYYRLLAMRMPGTLDGLKHGPGKDKLLQIIETLTRHRDPENLRFEFRKKAMSMADRIMEEATGYEDLLELRFFFQQIGERSNRKLLSRKTRELARTADIRAPLYRLLSTLEAEEFDEDGLLELVPAVVAKTESFIAEASLAHLELFLAFYLDTVCPLLRRLRSEPAHVARLMQNYKRQVGLLNIYRDLDHLAREMQRKVVLALCGPRMLARFPEKILGYLTRLPPEFYPDQVMAVLRTLIREKGPGYRFTSADVLRLIAAYPAEEEQGEQE